MRWCMASSVLLALMISAVFSAADEQLYRYKNKDGVVVISHYIPPELTANGYSILSSDGRILREVERQLSPAEIVERDRQEAAQERAELARQEAENYDRQLMQLYSSPEDVVYAMDRKLASLDELIDQTKSNIEGLMLQKQRLEKRGAELERSGETMSGEILQNLKIVDAQIQDKRKEIAKRRQEQEQVRKEFGERLLRIQQLYGHPDKSAGKPKPVG